MKAFLQTTLVLVCLLGGHMARADEVTQPVPAEAKASAALQQSQTAPVQVAWDRVGDKLTGWS